MGDPVMVVDYNSSWPSEFLRLSERTTRALDELAAGVEHVGSTAVPGLCAKPVIDLVVIIESEDEMPAAIKRLEAIGYRSKGDGGIPGRESFAWPKGEPRHHLYVSAKANPELIALLRFRDRLLSEPALADKYGALKRRLAQRHSHDRAAYTEAKTEFVLAALGHIPDKAM